MLPHPLLCIFGKLIIFFKKLSNSFFFLVYFTLCQTLENILLNIFMYTAKHYKMKIFSCKYFTLKKTEHNKCFLRKKKRKKKVFVAFYLEHSIWVMQKWILHYFVVKKKKKNTKTHSIGLFITIYIYIYIDR